VKRIVIAAGVALWCYATAALLQAFPWAAVVVFVAGGVGALLSLDALQ